MAGEWVDVDAPVNMIILDGIAPETIVNYIEENYPEYGINEISKETYGYGGELVNNVELRFNAQGEFLGVDY